ncbi:DUF892 family protein [Paracoccus litorisediminis]|uniref:DUF892 family protein n=1 Tax=Paracoccus litorisediminis TaxID=2006130 RepID=A0A844HTC0_9RHOB|nr:DUF892 family protein [Paracoccus litorisediminis]
MEDDDGDPTQVQFPQVGAQRGRDSAKTSRDQRSKRARVEKCEAIDGIRKEGESLLEDFGDSIAADAAIIFSCQAVEH